MNDDGPDTVALDCSNLCQGDLIEAASIHLGSLTGDSASVQSSLGVVLMSQTCDIIQPSKTRCIIAPVIGVEGQTVTDAKKGRKPLHLFLDSPEAEPACWVVDMELATSVLKADLAGRKILARFVSDASSADAGKIAARVGRAFNRFPFPGEVYPTFKRLRERVQSKSGSESPFGQVIDMVEDLRVSSDQWTAPGRTMTLYVVINGDLLISSEDADPSWVWDTTRINELKGNELAETLHLNRICELIISNREGDPTTLARLWHLFGRRVQLELLQPALNAEVSTFDVEVLSDTDMTYRQFQRSESLDLEVLSDSTGGAESKNPAHLPPANPQCP